MSDHNICIYLLRFSILGKISYNRRCLHDIGNTPNPYEQAISIIGRTLSAFDEDNLIPCFGFGDGKLMVQVSFLLITWWSSNKMFK
jgi:hypothetical protein